jgi:hypothetical protein
MKYFTYKLVSAANNWIDQTDRQLKLAEKRFWKTVSEYNLQLDQLKPRISISAWQFFRHGFAETGLHDGQLLTFKIGDGLNFVPDGQISFRHNHQRTCARVEILNYEQTFHHVFELRGLTNATMNIVLDEMSGNKYIGDLFTYELSALDNEHLQLGFLFATGAGIEITFRKLIYKRHRLTRNMA